MVMITRCVVGIDGLLQLADAHRGCSMLCAVSWGASHAIQGSVALYWYLLLNINDQRLWYIITGDTHTHMQTNPFRAEEANNYLLYITYVTISFVTKNIYWTIIALRTYLSMTLPMVCSSLMMLMSMTPRNMKYSINMTRVATSYDIMWLYLTWVFN